MTDEPAGSHEMWDELVAAQALHALDAAEQMRLLAHLDGCPSCQAQLDEYALVAAQLGSLADDDARPPAWADVRPRLLGSSPAASDSATAPVVPLRRRVGARVLAAAAAVVVSAGVGVGWQLSRPGAVDSATAALTACRQQSGCEVIRLRGRHGDNAAVLVEAGHASLVPVNMPRLSADRMYVLWQLPRDGSPTPLVTFRDLHRQTSSVPLVTGYADTAAFAVSAEPAGPMPTRPSDVVAVGAATS